MGTKKAKLNLDFGHSGISMNFAKAEDLQPRYGMERYWVIGTLSFNTEEFEDFPGISQHRIDENRIKIIDAAIERIMEDWEKESGYDFDGIEVTISAAFFDVLSFPYSFKFPEFRNITENDVKKIEENKMPDKMFQISIPDEKIKSLTSPYYTILVENDTIKRVLDPIGRRTKSLGFDAYFITKHPMLSRLLEVMKEAGEKIKVSLSCEKEFMALSDQKEKTGKIALIHISDFLSEFSIWENSELKYLNKKESGFKTLTETIWRLCVCYHIHPKLIEMDFQFTQNAEYMQKFYNMVKTSEISEDSRELLSADDCFDLLEHASCVLENETEESVKYSRLELPGKNKSKTGLTISNYVLCYFVREAIRNLLLEIKRTMHNDNFCQPDSIILESSRTIKGIEKLMIEVFEIPVRKAVVKWDGEIREDMPSAGIGSLQSLIGEKETVKIPSFWGRLFSRESA